MSAKRPTPEVNGEDEGKYVVEMPSIEERRVRRAMEAAKNLPSEMPLGQAAEYLGVSRRRVRELIEQGKLPCRQEGKRRLIPLEALKREKEEWFRAASAAADEMVRIAEECGLNQIEGSPPPKER